MHATQFLSQSEPTPLPGVVVLHGGESHLKREVLHKIAVQLLGEEGVELGLSRYSGKEADLRSIHDELLTVSMFSSMRVVCVDDADEFISQNRSALEEYVAKPSRQSVLVLEVKSWRKNTRLAKVVQKSGLEVECGELTGARLTGWLQEQVKVRFEKTLSREGAALIVELTGTGLAQLSREIEKLAAYVGEAKRITPEAVRSVVGGWRAETTWAMVDGIRDGDLPRALKALDRLLSAGDAPQKILGGITFVFRKFASATERSRHGLPLRVALQQAGVFPRDVDVAERYLRRVGRAHAERILEWLSEADANLKGGSRMAERVQLEQLLFLLSGPLLAR